MTRALRLAWLSTATVLAGLWTLAALGTWWLLQAGAAAIDTQSAAATLQAVSAWTERPWVRQMLDPDEADALVDAAGWLLGLGGGPAAWMGSALALIGAALLLAWAGGLLLGAAGLLGGWMLARGLVRLVSDWRRSGYRRPWVPAPGTPEAAAETAR